MRQTICIRIVDATYTLSVIFYDSVNTPYEYGESWSKSLFELLVILNKLFLLL